jgi:hypothetical protein
MDCYWYFAAERQAIYLRRLGNLPDPWTTDPILFRYRFTNVYRVTDRVSQYLLRNVIYNGRHSKIDLFFRILLFKLFNKIETWELLSSAVDELTFKHYQFSRFDKILSDAISSGRRIYSAAYIMPSGGGQYLRKHRAHLHLLEKMIADEAYKKLADMRTMREAFFFLKSYPMIGDFLAYQYVTDLNYSDLTDFSESEFVVAGPGARSGLSKCFSTLGAYSSEDIIRWVADQQEMEFARQELTFDFLGDRRLQLIDCQNLFCEIDKYSRARFPDVPGTSGRTRIKQNFSPRSEPSAPFFPPKWGIGNLSVRTPQAKAVAAR